MTLALKADTTIRIESLGNAGHTDSEDTMTAHYTVKVTGMGPIQDSPDEGEEKEVNFATVVGDTRPQIMVKAKAAVDAAIAAG